MKVFAWIWIVFMLLLTVALIVIPFLAIVANIVAFVLLDYPFLTVHDGARICLGVVSWFVITISTSKLFEDAIEVI